MKFENINGIQHIILEENDKVCLTTKDSSKGMSVDIECQNKGLNISGNSSIINIIKGDGMLEKVSIPPALSTDEIIEKCDQWLEMFRKVHDKFRELVLTPKYRKLNVTMELSFCEYFSFVDKNIKGRKIDLNLVQSGTIIKEGMTISIDECNERVYKYLLANVLEHYLTVNYANSQIKDSELTWERTLYSNDKRQDKSPVPVICKLGTLIDSTEYVKIVEALIANHNLNESSEQIIGNLKQEIYNQQMSERFSESINRSTTQFGYIISNSDKPIVLEKKNNN